MRLTRLAAAGIAAAGIALAGTGTAHAAAPTPAGSVVVNMGRLPLLIEHENGTQQWLLGAGTGAAIGYSTNSVRRVYLSCTNRAIQRIRGGGFLLRRLGWSPLWNNSYVRVYDCPIQQGKGVDLSRL